MLFVRPDKKKQTKNSPISSQRDQSLETHATLQMQLRHSQEMCKYRWSYWYLFNPYLIISHKKLPYYFIDFHSLQWSFSVPAGVVLINPATLSLLAQCWRTMICAPDKSWLPTWPISGHLPLPWTLMRLPWTRCCTGRTQKDSGRSV